MNRVYKLSFAFLLLVVFFGITSCEPSEPVAPVTAKSAENTHNAGLILWRYLLTSFSPAKIYYNESNQVKMAVHDGRYTTKYEWYLLNGQKYIKAEWYSFGQLTREDVYTLHATGRGVELTTKHFQFGGNVVKTDKYAFVYNGAGKLIRLYSQAVPQEQTKFTYDGSGNLQQVDYFKANGAALKTVTYSYTNEYHPSKISDYYHFNPELDNLDFYLPIFGTFSKHLRMKEHVENQDPSLADTNVYFKYNLNASGYPYLREKHWTNGSMKTTYYSFKAVKVGLD